MHISRFARKRPLVLILASALLSGVVFSSIAMAQDAAIASAAAGISAENAAEATSDKPRAAGRDYRAAAEFARLVDEIRGEGRVAVALAKAKSLQRFTSYMSPTDAAQKLGAAAAEVASPRVAFELWRQASVAELNGLGGSDGGLERAAEIRDAADLQGCLTDFEVVGPFDNPSMQGFHARLGPEEGQVGPYDGKRTRVDWRAHPDFDRLCVMQLGQTIEPTTAAVVYLANEIKAKRGGAAKLLLGASGAYKVWLNGEPVARRADDLGLGVDAATWPIKLKKGANHLLIKLASTGDGGLGLSARVVDPGFQPIGDLTHSAAWSGEAVQAADERKWPQSGADSLAKQAENLGETTDANAVWAAWLRMNLEPQNAATPWRATAVRVLERARQNPQAIPARELALAAELFEEHWQKLELLEMARELAPNDPWIAGDLAGEYANSEAIASQMKEREILDAVREQHPDFMPALIALTDWYISRGFDEKALQIISDFGAKTGSDDARNAFLEVPRYVSQLAYLTRAAGQRESARALYQKMESLAALNTGYAWRRADDLLAENDVDGALEIVEAHRKLVPWELRWQLRKVEILRARGDIPGAQTLLEQLVTERPGNVELYKQQAALLVALDQDVQAVEAVDKAIAQRPQDQDLRKFREFLSPASNRFFQPWIVEDVREIAAKTPTSAYSYDTIVDQTLVHVEPNGLSSTVVQRATRVMTDQGVDPASFQRVNFTRGDEQVEVLGVRVYKADGTISEDWDEWQSGGARKGSSTYNDSTYLNLRANNVQTGDIVEFRWRVSQIANENFRGDYFGDISYVQGTRPSALTRYVVHYPKSWKLYFREPTSAHRRVDKLPGEAKLKDGYQLTGFELGSIPEVHTDRNQPGYTDVYDYVMVSNKKDYNEIGRWWWNLVEEQLIVDDNIAQKVRELTRGLKTETEKVQAIHNYVVQNTRYLHVGLGIHGWKPYRTTTAFRNRYGDCKDKAALLKVMLDEAGIPAKLVLVRTRRLGHVEANPASMHIFNHAITYVPSMDLFLDGTAEFNGTTELTPMDQGAQALIVSDGGAAEFVTLPVDKPEQNLIQKEITVDLSGDKPVATGHVVAHGQNAVYYRQSLEDRDRRDEILEKQLAGTYPGAELRDATYSDLTKLEQPVEISFKFDGGEFLRKNSAREFVYAYGSPKDLLSAYARQASRTQDLSIRLPFLNHTTMRYVLPAGHTFEHAPRDTHLESPFGTVSVAYQLKDNVLEVDIRYGIAVQLVSTEDYPKFRQFMAKMTSALNDTIAIRSTQ